MNKTFPKVSVIMSVYNNSIFLPEAVLSILNQSYKNIEFIIVDDGSTEKVEEIINQFNDERIVFIKNSLNLGLTRSLNIGLKRATGKYIARMDADDISLESRISKQVVFLENHPHIGLVGTWANTIDKDGEILQIVRRSVSSEMIKWVLCFENPFNHSSVMIRRVLLENDLYSENIEVAQDYELWSRLSTKTSFYNMPEVLILLRKHQNSVSNIQHALQSKIAQEVAFSQMESYYPELNTQVVKNVFSGHPISLRDQVIFIKDIHHLYHIFKSKSDKKTLSLIKKRPCKKI